ncbi:MAG: hypothetical protein AB8E15_10330 [Bdellovibrionales bacterium]
MSNKLHFPLSDVCLKMNPPSTKPGRSFFFKANKFGKAYSPWASLGHLFFGLPVSKFISYSAPVNSPLNGKVMSILSDRPDREYMNLFVDLFRYGRLENLDSMNHVLIANEFFQVKLYGFMQNSMDLSVGDEVLEADFLGKIGAQVGLVQPGIWIEVFDSAQRKISFGFKDLIYLKDNKNIEGLPRQASLFQAQ